MANIYWRKKKEKTFPVKNTCSRSQSSFFYHRMQKNEQNDSAAGNIEFQGVLAKW